MSPIRRSAMRRLLVATALAAIVHPAAAQQDGRAEPARHEHELALGAVTFPNSGAAAAQAPFIRGIALLHSFEYEDAAAAFRDASRADPGFALAYWGEALTTSKLLWGLDAPDSARRILARLAPTPSARLRMATAGRERSFGAAVEALYADTTLAVRAVAFADSMRALARRDPRDMEASAFAAIAVLMSTAAGPLPPERLTALRHEAIGLARRVYEANPRHPGAAHYLIHAYDHPALAAGGLEFARAYARIAPAAEHALHMPSHIFVQLGLWDDLTGSNEQAWAASRAWVRRQGRPPTDLDFHSLGWLQYGYVQQGRLAAARAIIDTARSVLAGHDLSGEIDARFAVGELTFMAAAALGDWAPTSAIAVPPPAPDGASVRERTFTHIARVQGGYAAAMRGDTAAARQVSRETSAAEAALPAGSGGRARLALGRLHIDAALARRQGDRARELALLREAVAIEDAASPGGPPWSVPAHEQLAAALLAARRPAEAIAVLDRALALRPGRSEALLLLVRARRDAGTKADADQARRRLEANWHRADPEMVQRIP